MTMAWRIGSIALLALLATGCTMLSMPTSAASRVLAPCPASPKCVSSQSEDQAHFIEPLQFTGSMDAAWQHLINLLKTSKRTKIVEQADFYLRAEVTSLIFRFVDDVEFLILPEGQVIHVRSSARTGYSDFGVNRKRIERLRIRFGADHVFK